MDDYLSYFKYAGNLYGNGYGGKSKGYGCGFGGNILGNGSGDSWGNHLRSLDENIRKSNNG
jgi:hypothetical protein